MPHLTIPDLVPVTPPLDGTELFELDQGGASFNASTDDIRGHGISSIVTGAAPTDVSTFGCVYKVTTGGTGGAEVINLITPTLDIGGFVNAAKIGQQIVVALEHQTAGADKVTFTIDGAAASFTPYQNPAAGGVSKYNGIQLEFEGALAVFTWSADTWALDIDASDYLMTYQVVPAAAAVSGGDATAAVNSQAVYLHGGKGSAAHTAGADTYIDGGQPNGAGAAGHIRLGTLQALPTADPGIPGAIWADPVTHVLKISP